MKQAAIHTAGRFSQFVPDTAWERPSCAHASTPCPNDILAAKVGNVGIYSGVTVDGR